MIHGALFNGIAGFPLAASWSGIPTAWTVEIDEFCNKVSKKHFPDAIQYADIRTARNLPYVDILTGGFPCQPFSVAGKQKGKEDDRFLWPEMLRVIREVRPTYIIGENVAGIIRLALDEVLASLEREGFQTETFLIPACSLNAPHKRDRVWIVAYSDNNRTRATRDSNGASSKKGPTLSTSGQGRKRETFFDNGFRALPIDVADTDASGLQKRFCSELNGISEKAIAPQGSEFTRNNPTQDWSEFPAESPICGGNDGVPNRVDRIGALGNAIVPQVAYQLFEAIKQHAQSA